MTTVIETDGRLPKVEALLESSEQGKLSLKIADLTLNTQLALFGEQILPQTPKPNRVDFAADLWFTHLTSTPPHQAVEALALIDSAHGHNSFQEALIIGMVANTVILQSKRVDPKTLPLGEIIDIAKNIAVHGNISQHDILDSNGKKRNFAIGAYTAGRKYPGNERIKDFTENFDALREEIAGIQERMAEVEPFLKINLPDGGPYGLKTAQEALNGIPTGKVSLEIARNLYQLRHHGRSLPVIGPYAADFQNKEIITEALDIWRKHFSNNPPINTYIDVSELVLNEDKLPAFNTAAALKMLPDGIIKSHSDKSDLEEMISLANGLSPLFDTKKKFAGRIEALLFSKDGITVLEYLLTDLRNRGGEHYRPITLDRLIHVLPSIVSIAEAVNGMKEKEDKLTITPHGPTALKVADCLYHLEFNEHINDGGFNYKAPHAIEKAAYIDLAENIWRKYLAQTDSAEWINQFMELFDNQNGTIALQIAGFAGHLLFPEAAKEHSKAEILDQIGPLISQANMIKTHLDESPELSAEVGKYMISPSQRNVFLNHLAVSTVSKKFFASQPDGQFLSETLYRAVGLEPPKKRKKST